MRIEEMDARHSRVTWDDPSECPVGYRRSFSVEGVVFDRQAKYACLYCGTIVDREMARAYWRRHGLPATGEFLENHEVCSLCANPEAVNLGPR